jgi:hypothetical protein
MKDLCRETIKNKSSNNSNPFYYTSRGLTDVILFTKTGDNLGRYTKELSVVEAYGYFVRMSNKVVYLKTLEKI